MTWYFIVAISVVQVVGRHVASDRMVSGAYKTEFGETDEITRCMKKVEVGFYEGTVKVVFFKLRCLDEKISLTMYVPFCLDTADISLLPKIQLIAMKIQRFERRLFKNSTFNI